MFELLSNNLKDMNKAREVKDTGIKADARISPTKDEAKAMKNYEDYMKSGQIKLSEEDMKKINQISKNVTKNFIIDKINKVLEDGAS
jgi:hypothetical protein